MGMEMDDDIFFADLSKQIALLIMDDDEDDEVEEFPVQSPPLHALQGLHHHVPQMMMMPPPYMMHEMSSYRSRESKGTGVFIPRSALPTRKNKSSNSGKSTTVNNSSQRHHHLHKSRVNAASRAASNDTALNATYHRNSAHLKNRA